MEQGIGLIFQNVTLLLPMVALIMWTLFITTWMICLRVIQALNNARAVEATSGEMSAEQAESLYPARLKWKGDNANNLLEQPMLFYVLILSMMVSGYQDVVSLMAAWIYVVLRIMHSLWQCLVNTVVVRFLIYICFTLDLAFMVARFGFQILD